MIKIEMQAIDFLPPDTVKIEIFILNRLKKNSHFFSLFQASHADRLKASGSTTSFTKPSSSKVKNRYSGYYLPKE